MDTLKTGTRLALDGFEVGNDVTDIVAVKREFRHGGVAGHEAFAQRLFQVFDRIALAEGAKRRRVLDRAVTTADAVGTFTCKGVAKEMTVPVKLTYLKDKLGDRVPKMKGDLLVIRSNFSIKRSDFNINPGKLEDKVSDEIELTLSVAGAAAK